MGKIFLPFAVLPLLIGTAWAKTINLGHMEVNSASGADPIALSMESQTLPAGVSVLEAPQIEAMSVSHYLDFFRQTPGMTTGSMGQGDVVDYLGLRGFDGGHGGSIAVYIDGMPVNMPHHSHTHGFADFAYLTPEMIERIEVIKGPFSPLYGNFAQAGVINITTKRSAPTALLVQAGSFARAGASAVVSSHHGSFTPLVIAETLRKEGYRDNGEYQRYNLLARTTLHREDADISVKLHLVKRDWGAPGYLALNDVKSGAVSRTSGNSALGGESAYAHLVVNRTPADYERGWHWNVFAAHEEHHRNPDAGSDHEENSRILTGANGLNNRLLGAETFLTTGFDLRYDNGDRKTSDGANHWQMTELSAGVFAQIQHRLTDKTKLTGGLRYDAFLTDITNKTKPANSGDGTFALATPRIGIAHAATPAVTFYANAGQGFRTPAANEISPIDSNVSDTSNFSLKPSRLTSADAGVIWLAAEGLRLELSTFWTHMENEIASVSDGPSKNLGETERKGSELAVRYRAGEAWMMHGSYTATHATAEGSSDRLGGVPQDQWTLGVNHRAKLGGATVQTDLNWQHLGKTPLMDYGTPTQTSYRDQLNRYQLKARYIRKTYEVYAQAAHQPDQEAGETMWAYNDAVNFDPMPVWEFEAGVKYRF
ncbi:MAG: TonB-dependent receptor [Campylobacterales bacterium]